MYSQRSQSLFYISIIKRQSADYIQYCGGGEILLESLGDMEKVRTFVAVVWE